MTVPERSFEEHQAAWKQHFLRDGGRAPLPDWFNFSVYQDMCNRRLRDKAVLPRSKYTPHQGTAECERRRRQMERRA